MLKLLCPGGKRQEKELKESLHNGAETLSVLDRALLPAQMLSGQDWLKVLPLFTFPTPQRRIRWLTIYSSYKLFLTVQKQSTSMTIHSALAIHCFTELWALSQQVLSTSSVKCSGPDTTASFRLNTDWGC